MIAPSSQPRTRSGIGLDLSRLCREPVFTSQSPQESRHLLARELVDHELRWGHGTVDTAFFRAEIGRCDLLVLRYGAEVEIRPEPFNDFILIQMPLLGSASLECDGLQYSVQPGEVAILSPRDDARLVWHRDCEQLILKVPRSLLQLSQSRLMETGGLPADFVFPSIHRLEGGVATRWFRLVSDLLDHLPGAEQALGHPHWLRHVEESLPLFLLSHHPAALSVAAQVTLSAGQRQGLMQLQKIEAFMRSRLGRGVTLGELAAVGGLSARSLNTLCQQHYGQTPMERFRVLRLDAARDRLLGRPDLSITEVALEYGFSHFGRFACYYRDRFGELPRHTQEPERGRTLLSNIP